MKVAVMIVAMLALASATKWYATHDLPEWRQAELTRQGCDRGNYGGVKNNGDARTMTLTTCPTDKSVFIGEYADDTFLCVIELSSREFIGAALDTIKAHETTRVVYTGRQEIVILDEATGAEMPELCYEHGFPAGVVDNAMYVAKTAIIPQQPAPMHNAALKKLHANVSRPDDNIMRWMVQMTQAQVTAHTRMFATDRNNGNTFITRNSYATSFGSGRGGCATNAWKCAFENVNELVASLKTMFASYPGTVSVETSQFRTDMCHNVVLKMEGTTTPSEIVVSGAHLDSRNTGSGSTATGAAPGADDNGSGSAVLYEMARVIAANNVRFHNSVHFLWFCGEEQGLLGSANLANAYAARGDRIVGMFNNDMIGYTRPNLPVVLSFMTGSATAWLSAACEAFSNTYLPQLQVGRTSACCSDQQSFFRAGFPAAGIFETPTSSVVYPQYHRTGDTWDNGLINYEQVWRFGQANFVCMLEFAEPDVPTPTDVSV